MTNTIEDVKSADVIFVTGSNTTEAHPVMGMMIRQAVAEGKKLIVADPKRIDLANIADVYLQIKPGTSVALSNTMLNISTPHVADMMIPGNTRGITDLLKVKHNNKNTGSFANELAEELMDFEEENIERLKRFL